MKRLSTTQLAQYLGVTKRTIQRRCVREDWPYIEQKGLGGVRKMYDFAGLPATVRQQVVVHIVAKHEKLGANYVPPAKVKPRKLSVYDLADSPFIVFDKTKTGDWLSQHSFAHELDDTGFDNAELDKEYIKAGLLELARLYIFTFSLSKIKGFDQFCQSYNAHQFALNNTVYEIVSKVSRITLLRWEKQQQLNGREQHLLSIGADDSIIYARDLREIAKEILLVSPDVSAARLRSHLLTIFPQRKIPCVSQWVKWLSQQRASDNESAQLEEKQVNP